MKKYAALLLDFYGTLVAEDDAIIGDILRQIAAVSPVCDDPNRIGRDWRFAEYCDAAYGDDFKTQRALERDSLQKLLKTYQVEMDSAAQCERLYAYWRKPEVYADAAAFLERVDVPVCIVSNIDRDDLDAAIAHAGWDLAHIVTSEGCRSYKPREEMFLCALETLSCAAGDVLHIGDSLTSDVGGAQRLGIDTAWVNRKGKNLPDSAKAPTYNVSNLAALAERTRA